MRQREALALLLLLSVVALAGCSRLTFLKPDTSRSGYTQIAPEVDITNSDPSPMLAARDHLIVAQRHLRNGELDQAEDNAEAALEAYPRSVAAHTLLAIIAQHHGDANEAGAHFARAAELAPMQGTTLNNYGTWLCKQGRAAESLAWFDRALASPGYPTPADALANAGSCALKAGQHARAERDLHRAIEIDPKNAVALGALAELSLVSGNAFQARAYSQRRLAAAPADADALRLASQIEVKLGDMAAAERYTRQLQAEFGTSTRADNGDNRSR